MMNIEELRKIFCEEWCCAGTATTSCVTRHPNHSSNLLIKTCQHG